MELLRRRTQDGFADTINKRDGLWRAKVIAQLTTERAGGAVACQRKLAASCQRW